MSIDAFFDECGLEAEARGVARLELLTGCARCGRRVVCTNNQGAYVRGGTAVLRVEERGGRCVAAYALCRECVEEMP